MYSSTLLYEFMSNLFKRNLKTVISCNELGDIAIIN